MKFAYLIEPPFNYLTAEGEVTGTDVELAKTILTKIGYNRFEPIEAEFADLLPGVASGKWRMTTGLFATEERKKIASFSKPIWALPDGLLVPLGNPLGLTGYQSVAQSDDCTLAVIRDQFQHRSAVELGVPEERLMIFETYTEAANAVKNNLADAYASVARAHVGYIELHNQIDLDVVDVPTTEKLPAFGCFGFSHSDVELRELVDCALVDYLGSSDHRSLMYQFGFSDSEIDLVCSKK